MYFMLKKSKLTAWWVAKKDNKLTFVNICDKKQLSNDLVVVGFFKDDYYPDELGRSSNHVVKVTKKGVITSKGSFYPFEEAHALYIEFLNDINTKEAVIAFNWKLNKNTMTADIIRNGEVAKDVTFDFDSYFTNSKSIGYSEKLQSDVVISPFSRRGVCMTLSIPMEIWSDMRLNSGFAYECEKRQCINRLKSFVK